LELAVLPSAEAQPLALAIKPATSRRNGRIARLPKLERDMVNRMLQNGVPYPNIVAALGELGITVTERNISNWKTRGGYREWTFAQECALETRLHQDAIVDLLRHEDASHIPEVGLQLAATYLSQFLLKPESRQELETDPDKLTPVVANLCRLSKEIHKLQKSRDGSAKALDRQNAPERVKRENEELLPSLMEVYGTKKLVSPARPPQKQLSRAPIPPSKEQPKPQP